MRIQEFSIIPIVFILILLLSSCAESPTSSAGTITPIPLVQLKQLSWCVHPTLAFSDESTDPATTTDNWKSFSTKLGFVPLLPFALPSSACLISADATINHPAFGSRFAITYAMGNRGSLSIAETRTHLLKPEPQCSDEQSNEQTLPVVTCRQLVSNLDVTLSVDGQSTQAAINYLSQLRPNADWLPAK
jgi:hypothetical protein